MARIAWPKAIRDILLELPEKDRDLILARVDLLQRFPRLFPVRVRGRFRGHRWFLAGPWLVYYRLVGSTVYIRALWPAHIP